MGGSSHSHDSSDEIVLNQEKVLSYGVIGFVLALLTIFTLAQAGRTSFDYSSGENAYKMIEQDKVNLKSYQFNKFEENKNNQANTTSNEKNNQMHNNNHHDGHNH